jgi:hypothetical protein
VLTTPSPKNIHVMKYSQYEIIGVDFGIPGYILIYNLNLSDIEKNENKMRQCIRCLLSLKKAYDSVRLKNSIIF